MLFKVIIFSLMLVILFSLASGLFYLLKMNKDPKRVVKALTWRVVLSLVLVIFLLIAHSFGWIQTSDIITTTP